MEIGNLKLKYLIDSEYFSHGSVGSPDFYFSFKEISIISLTSDQSWHWLFELRPIPHGNDSVMKTLKEQRALSRFFFSPVPGVKHYKQEEVGELIFNEIINKDPDFDPSTSAFAYKGGQIEALLMGHLQLHSFNIENLGCPKFEHLINDDVEMIRIAIEKDCSHHKFIPEYKLRRRYKKRGLHCSQSEVVCFKLFLERYFTNQRMVQ